MSRIPTQLTPEVFAEHVEPYLSKAKRGYAIGSEADISQKDDGLACGSG